MPKSTDFANRLLNLILRAVAWSGVALPDSGSPNVSNIYLRLHTGALAPGDPGNTNEATFGGYAAKAIVRSTSGWDAASGGSSANSALAQFDECTSGSNTITHVSINTQPTGTGACLWSGALASSRSISAGIQPQFAAGALVVTET
jgi:hypothetical protein